MTQTEFYQAQIISRKRYLKLFGRINQDIHNLYVDATKEITAKIKDNKNVGKSFLNPLLAKTGAHIAGETEKLIINGITDLAGITGEPHTRYIKDALLLYRKANREIDFTIIENIFEQVNQILIDLTYSRLWADGYNFSNRVWGVPEGLEQPYLPGISEYWQDGMKNVIAFGLANNRDILQIAKDLNDYVKSGKKSWMKRYGNIIRGTRKFSRRIPKWIDYRAIRLARTELYISLQEAAKLQGKYNPAVKQYRWNLTAGAAHDTCICPDLAADSPYLETDVPDHPHANCLCWISHVIMGRDEFVNDLIDWGNGLGVPYLDNWFVNVYLPFMG